VGEVESADPVGPSRVRESVKPAGTVSGSPDLQGIGLPCEVLNRLVAAIRFAAPASPFLRPRGLPGRSILRRSAGNSLELGLPFKAHLTSSAGVLRGSGSPSWGFLPLQRSGQGGPLARVSIPGSFRLQGFPTS
jgi:hypothetical protein